jgi:hypothetical protein
VPPLRPNSPCQLGPRYAPTSSHAKARSGSGATLSPQCSGPANEWIPACTVDLACLNLLCFKRSRSSGAGFGRHSPCRRSWESFGPVAPLSPLLASSSPILPARGMALLSCPWPSPAEQVSGVVTRHALSPPRPPIFYSRSRLPGVLPLVSPNLSRAMVTDKQGVVPISQLTWG